jgi:hypothetical protein
MSQHSRLDYDLCNPIIIPPTQFHARPARLIKTTYTCNGADALIGMDLAKDIVLWTATANFIDLPPEDGCVWIDNEGPNRGLMDALIRAHVIEFNDRFTGTNKGYAFECKLMI